MKMKNNAKYKKGDLVYLPSRTRLIQLDNHGVPVKQHETQKPKNVLVLGEEGRTSGHTILVDGEEWCTDTTNLYPIKEVIYG